MCGFWLNVALVACAGTPPASPLPPKSVVSSSTPADDAAAPQAEAPVAVTPAPDPVPPSTATYEEATAAPESLDVHDDHAHLTDDVLTGPMRGVLARCRVPANAKVAIKTAVQNGHAIGVSVSVAFEHPKSKKRLPRKTARYEAKAAASIAACADRAVRALTWPPSRRRDSFTTSF